MKRTIIFTLMLLCICSAFAQEITRSEDGLTVTYTKTDAITLAPVVRSGNTYVVGNRIMNPKAFNLYLQSTCPAAFIKFNQGQNLSYAGWGFLAGGLALTTTAVSMGFVRPVKDGVTPYHHAMNAMYYTGNAFCAVSIPLLIVGYCKQHNAANIYNEQCAKQQAYFSINAGNNGIGLALNF